jgi:hypothetical protein
LAFQVKGKPRVSWPLQEETVISFLKENWEEVSESSLEPVRKVAESSFVEPVDSFACDRVVTGMCVKLMAL